MTQTFPIKQGRDDACAEYPGMDGHGRAKDNIWIERFWKKIKYEYIYIQPEETAQTCSLFYFILIWYD